MSYVRWSSVGHPWQYDSDLYIYDSADGTVCWSAEPVLLDGPHPEPWIGDQDDPDGPHPETVEHVKAHIAAGHRVPEFVIPRLEIAQGY